MPITADQKDAITESLKKQHFRFEYLTLSKDGKSVTLNRAGNVATYGIRRGLFNRSFYYLRQQKEISLWRWVLLYWTDVTPTTVNRALY